MKTESVLAVILALGYGVSRPSVGSADLGWSDSGIKGPKYEQIVKNLRNFQESYPDLVTFTEYGKSVKGRPLNLLIVMKKKVSALSSRPTLLMSGSTHGNEYLGIEDRLPEEILKRASEKGTVSQFLDQGGAFVFIPILNPDGYEAHSRENAHGVDLNRDWDVAPAGIKGFKEAETRRLAEEVERIRSVHHLKYEITVDYHCCVGALLHPWSFREGPLVSKEETARFQDVGAMITRHLKVNVGTTGQLLGYHPGGTTKDYYFDRYRALAFTYEGKHREEVDLLSNHVAWWEDMVKMVTGSFSRPLLSVWPAVKPAKLPRFAD